MKNRVKTYGGTDKVGRGDSTIDHISLENMSHQLKTPLNAIVGFSESLLASPSLTDAEREAVATINSSGKNMLNMVNDILDIEKIQAGRITFDKQPVDIVHFLENIAATIRPKLNHLNASLRVRLADGIPRYILVDERRLFQIMTNFLTEILESSAEKNIVLAIDTKDKSLICTISNGPHRGMDDEPNAASPEPVIDAQKRNLKPALIIGTLLVQCMGGEAFVRKISGQNAGFFFHITFEKTGHDDVTSGGAVDFNGGHGDRNAENYDISRIPEDLRSEMFDAVKKVRFDILASLIKQAETYDIHFAERLQHLAKEYNYEVILQMLGQKI